MTSQHFLTVLACVTSDLCTFILYSKISEASDAVSIDFLLFQADATRLEKSYRPASRDGSKA